MLIRSSSRPYAPMTSIDVVEIHAAGRRVKALDFIIERALQNNGRGTALAAQRMAKGIREEVYRKYDVRL